MKVVSFKLDDELLELLDEYARRNNKTKSEIIRKALTEFFTKRDEKPFTTKRITIY